MYKRISTLGLTLTFLMGFCFHGNLFGMYYRNFAIEGDYVYLKRDRTHEADLVQTAGFPQPPLPIIPKTPCGPKPEKPSKCTKPEGHDLITTNNLSNRMSYEPGLRVSFKLFYNTCSTWEFRYTGLLHWKGKKEVECPHNLRIPTCFVDQTQDYKFADRASSIYCSDFFTYDLNYWRHVTPQYINMFSVSWTMGLRYIDIDEKLRLSFTKNESSSHYRVKTFSHLFGPQFGGDFECNPYRWLTWGFGVRLGPLFCHSEQRTFMNDVNGTVVLKDFHRRGSNFAYLAEVFPFIDFFVTRHFTFHFSYEVFHVGNVALADNQVDFLDGDDLHHKGNITYHGFFAGLQFNF